MTGESGEQPFRLFATFCRRRASLRKAHPGRRSIRQVSSTTEPSDTTRANPGAVSRAAPRRTPPTPDTASLSPDERVVPTWTNSGTRQLSRVVGGPLGRHAVVGRHWFWTPLRVCLLLAITTLAIGWSVKAPCLQTYVDDHGQQQLDWRNNHQYIAMCYSDTIPLYSTEQLDRGAFPYATRWSEDAGNGQQHARYMEYPVVTGMFQWINAKLAAGWHSAGWLPASIPVINYFDITAFWLACAWLAAVWALCRITRRRPWDAAVAAISPLVIIQAFTNFDLLAAGFACAGLLAWARKKPGWAGVLLGIGGAAKLYPLFLLGPLLILCVRSGRLREGFNATGAALLTWLVINAPIAFLYPKGWWEFFRLNTDRGADPDSLYNALSYFTGWPGFDPGKTVPAVLNTVTAVLFLACCAGIGWMALSAPRRPRLGQLAFLVVAAFLLTNKVWSPQYSLWLVPFAVLALPRWRLLLGWMVVDALVWFPRMEYYLGVDNKGLPQGWFLSTVILRDLVVIGLCALIIHSIYRPDTDLVRFSGDDDPAGGVIEDSRDHFVLGRAKRTARQSAIGVSQ